MVHRDDVAEVGLCATFQQRSICGLHALVAGLPRGEHHVVRDVAKVGVRCGVFGAMGADVTERVAVGSGVDDNVGRHLVEPEVAATNRLPHSINCQLKRH